jgi:hypothetical protein
MGRVLRASIRIQVQALARRFDDLGNAQHLSNIKGFFRTRESLAWRWRGASCGFPRCEAPLASAIHPSTMHSFPCIPGHFSHIFLGGKEHPRIASSYSLLWCRIFSWEFPRGLGGGFFFFLSCERTLDRVDIPHFEKCVVYDTPKTIWHLLICGLFLCEFFGGRKGSS